MTEDGDEARSAWTQPAFLAAAGVVAIILVFGAVAILGVGGGKRAAEPPAPARSAPVVTREAGGQAGGGVCKLAAGSQTVPTSAPAGTTWELVGTMAAPEAEGVGPGATTHGVRACYARSPVGALYAAANFVAAASAPSLRGAAAAYLTAAGAGRELSLRRERQEGGQGEAKSAEGNLQVVGFAFTSYAPTRAVLGLAMRVDAGQRGAYVELPVAMVWEGDDWKYVVPETGEPFGGLQRVASLAGYVPWSGV